MTSSNPVSFLQNPAAIADYVTSLTRLFDSQAPEAELDPAILSEAQFNTIDPPELVPAPGLARYPAFNRHLFNLLKTISSSTTLTKDNLRSRLPPSSLTSYFDKHFDNLRLNMRVPRRDAIEAYALKYISDVVSSLRIPFSSPIQVEHLTEELFQAIEQQRAFDRRPLDQARDNRHLVYDLTREILTQQQKDSKIPPRSLFAGGHQRITPRNPPITRANFCDRIIPLVLKHFPIPAAQTAPPNKTRPLKDSVLVDNLIRADAARMSQDEFLSDEGIDEMGMRIIAYVADSILAGLISETGEEVARTLAKRATHIPELSLQTSRLSPSSEDPVSSLLFQLEMGDPVDLSHLSEPLRNQIQKQIWIDLGSPREFGRLHGEEAFRHFEDPTPLFQDLTGRQLIVRALKQIQKDNQERAALENLAKALEDPSATVTTEGLSVDLINRIKASIWVVLDRPMEPYRSHGDEVLARMNDRTSVMLGRTCTSITLSAVQALLSNKV